MHVHLLDFVEPCPYSSPCLSSYRPRRVILPTPGSTMQGLTVIIQMASSVAYEVILARLPLRQLASKERWRQLSRTTDSRGRATDRCTKTRSHEMSLAADQVMTPISLACTRSLMLNQPVFSRHIAGSGKRRNSLLAPLCAASAAAAAASSFAPCLPLPLSFSLVVVATFLASVVAAWHFSAHAPTERTQNQRLAELSGAPGILKASNKKRSSATRPRSRGPAWKTHSLDEPIGEHSMCPTQRPQYIAVKIAAA
jgi:membrane protein implicated in regulation of membrane protease activity